MKLVGFHYNRSPLDEKRRLRPSVVNRIVLIDGFLREAGLRLFVYAPHHIKPADETIEGYLFENGQFLPSTTKIPTVNGNWTHRTRRLLEEGMGYQQFGKWVEERRIGDLRPPRRSPELLGNKHETYKLVRGFHETLHPHSELYARSERQLAYFVETGRITFLKPRTGQQGRSDHHPPTRRDRAVRHLLRGRRAQAPRGQDARRRIRAASAG